MTKLNDTQSIVLSAAGQRDNGSLYPLPATLLDGEDRATKAVAALVKRGLAEERESDDAAGIVREDGDLRFGVFITPAGLSAIGLGEALDEGAFATPPSSAPEPTKSARQTKSASVIALLQRDEGATVLELIVATGWLPHTTRAALTGLRKKGHTIVRDKRDGATCYRIVAAA
jgi:hypothetical protein